MLGAALTCVLLEVSSAAVSYTVSARVDSRVRSNEVAGDEDAPSVAGDTDVVPTLGLERRDGNVLLQLDYAPRISLREVTVRPRTEVQHTGRLGATWRPERGLSFRLAEELTLGSVNLFITDLGTGPPLDPADPGGEPGDGPLTPSDGGPLSPLPGTDTVYFVSSATHLTMDTSWLGRRWQLSGSTGFSVSGGLDATARETVPLQYGPRFDVSLSRALSSRSALTTAVGASHSRFSNGANNTVVTLTEAWGLRWSRRTAFEAGFGASLVRAQEAPSTEEPAEGEAPEGPRVGVIPNLTLGVNHRVPSRAADFTGRVGLRLSPFVDRLTGRVYPRADLTTSGTWALGPRVRLSPSLGTAFAVGGATGDRIVSGGITGSWTLSRVVSVDADMRSTWSRSPELPAAQLNWAATLGLTVRQTGIL